MFRQIRFYPFKAVQQCNGYSEHNLQLNPCFVSGFTDGEGCFSIKIIENKKLKIGLTAQLRFSMALHKKDKVLLEQIKNFLVLEKFIHKDHP